MKQYEKKSDKVKATSTLQPRKPQIERIDGHNLNKIAGLENTVKKLKRTNDRLSKELKDVTAYANKLAAKLNRYNGY